ncbi:MAG TPA: hypothetical protein VF730_08015 [Terracidiphilus sp.]
MLAALALLMTFLQAPPRAATQSPGSAPVAHPNPAPPSTQIHPASPSSAPAQAAAPGQGATNPQTSPQQTPAPSQSTSCENGNCDEWPTSVKVANPPPAVPFWPFHDRVLWAAMLVLVVFGYVGIWIAVSTLKKIERNTKSGEEAAAAAYDTARSALLHAEAIVKNDRPWILVAIEPSPGVANGFTVTASNRGRTPARIFAIPHKIEFAGDESDLPEVPQYQEASTSAPFVPIILLPGEFAQIATFSRDEVKELCESEEQFTRVENWEEKIFIYGRVTYRDLLSPQDEQIHQSAWCFWYIHGHQNSGMVPAGTSNYNLHT